MAFFIGTIYHFIHAGLSVYQITRGPFNNTCYKFVVALRFLLCLGCMIGLAMFNIFGPKSGHKNPPHTGANDPPYEHKTYFYLATSGEWVLILSFFAIVLTFAYEFQRINIRIRLSQGLNSADNEKQNVNQRARKNPTRKNPKNRGA